MPNEIGPVLLDISRSIARAGHRHMTGIDRVERQYFLEILSGKTSSGFLAKVPGGTYFLDRDSGKKILSLIEDPDSESVGDGWSQFIPFRCRKRGQLESVVRRLGKNIRRLDPSAHSGYVYLNVGHSNLNVRAISRLRKGPARKIIIMLHDTIPLDHPEFSRASSSWRFPAKLRAMAEADLVICNSQATLLRGEHWFAKYGIKAHSCVVPLGMTGLDATKRNPAQPPRFLVLGTIEPRKNHELLLDVWELFRQELPEDAIPHLDIIGARGWRNRRVFARLDRLQRTSNHVHELGAVSDVELGNILESATALLFPSLAEGFGLPVVESLNAGLPVICSDLPVLRETGGTGPLFLPATDARLWAEAVLDRAARTGEPSVRHDTADWRSHFCHVFERVASLG